MEANLSNIIEITSIDNEGRGIGHQNDKTIFVDNALINEKVRFKVLKKKKKILFARAEEILKESTQRVSPICSFYGVCGGCSMQHFRGSSQLAYKQRAFEETLQHVGKVRPETILSPIEGPQHSYRHKARFRVKFVKKKNKVLIGFNEKKSHFLTDMNMCAVVPKKISILLEPLQLLFNTLSIKDKIPQIEYASNQERHILVVRILEELSNSDVKNLKLFQETHEVEFWTQTKGYDTIKPLIKTMHTEITYSNIEFGLNFIFQPTSFTQINPFINLVLIRRAMALLQPKEGEIIIDFFSGLGNFTLPIATFSSSVIGVEGDDALVESGRKNAEKNNLSENINFVKVDLFNASQEDIKSLGNADKWLIDPPRDGAFNLINLINSDIQPRRIVYISCNPATLARDANILINEKGYKYSKSGILNMFPHTSHVESIALFELNV
ncbi:MAG: 23S rRNA (uracil(1939)-C(5))-methyltransferase RlmD [Methylophilaceae bacterium]|nr:23S rRNA (uracil(1939)-C(5))-methyltransferase RlmD [Methylophilaceae bacterium]